VDIQLCLIVCACNFSSVHWHCCKISERLLWEEYGSIEKYLNVTSVLDTCIAVSKRAVFGNCVNGTWEGVGALCWV
jgi:hypothetical protein